MPTTVNVVAGDVADFATLAWSSIFWECRPISPIAPGWQDKPTISVHTNFTQSCQLTVLTLAISLRIG